MKTLVIFRHAKSAWDNPILRDHDRSLAPRGRNAAPKMGAWFHEKEISPDHILCSSSQRTRETLSAALPYFTSEQRITITEHVYHGSGTDYVEMIKAEPDATNTLMLLGHNPSCEDAAAFFASRGDPALLSMMASKFPTAAAAVIRFEVARWSDLVPGCGELLHFQIPRLLKGLEV